MFYLYSLLFWFALLVTALINAVIREKLLKPWLEPSIGRWAHQLSVPTGFVLMLLATMLFLKYQKAPYKPADLWIVGMLWCIITLVFEFGFGKARGMSWSELFAAYHLWKGELWMLLLLSLIVMPTLAHKLLK